MRPLLLVVGAIALAFIGPALARPGMAHGNGGPFAYGPRVAPGYEVGPGWSHGYGRNRPAGYGVGGCPPGLAKKAVPCIPPGQVKKLGLGRSVPLGYNLLGYYSLPRTIRTHHRLSIGGRYLYRGGIVYEVNPRTRVVTRVIPIR